MLSLISIFLTKYQSWPGKKPKPLSLPKLCSIVSLLVPCNVAPTFTCWVLEDTEVAQCHGQQASEAWWNLPFCSQNSGDYYAWNSSSVISTASFCLWLLKEKEQYHTTLISSEKKENKSQFTCSETGFPDYKIFGENCLRNSLVFWRSRQVPPGTLMLCIWC